ncbi:MAG: CotH kinase family protein [Oscillospiraceae bacterium]|nr:CotH kinase family protein [Oscillospiraceae bacterium]
MAVKRILSGFLTASLLMSLCGCGQFEEAVDTQLGTQIDKQEIQTETDIHLRDKNLLYTQHDNTEIVTMYLTVSKGNDAEGTNHTWEEVNTYSAYDYEEMGVDRYKVAGLLQVGNEDGLVPGEFGYGQVAPNCTVQIRGQSSSRNPQKNYKIAIKDNKGDWRGQTTIALNKHQGDGLRFRNKLAFDLISHIDELMGLRTTFVRLYVKDTTAGANAKFQDYGIYTQVEQLNKTALKAHGLDNRGHLYKVNYCEFYRYEDIIVKKDDPRYDVKKFEEILEIKGDDDHTKLIEMLQKVNDFSIPIEEILEENFDLENIAYWMAFNLMLGNVDTQSRNFYLYSPQNVDRWYILPWDIDGALRRTEYALVGRTDYEHWESGISNYWGNVLFQRCLKSETFRKALDDAMQDLQSVLTEDLVNSYVDAYSKLLKPYVFSGRDLRYAPLTPAKYDAVVSGINAEIDDNYNRYLESLKKPMPFFIGVPQEKDGGYTVQWDASFDFEGEDITYTFELAKDYYFKNPIVKQTGLAIPMAKFDKLPRGQYFMRVMATNESGQTQYAFDCYVLERGKIYGTKCFYVDEKGQIVEDIYVDE